MHNYKIMNEDFNFRAAAKTDEQLQECIDNREKYLPESVEAAVAELQSRGQVFTDEELTVIGEDMQARRELALTPPGYDSLFNNSEKIKQVEDPDAPAFYSKRAIYVFSILFSVLFGAILLAINVNKTEKRGNVIWILLYGVSFLAACTLLAQTYTFNTGFSVIAGIIGAYPLNYFFWGSYIGHHTLYRVKPIWPPLIIGFAFAIIIVILILRYSPGTI